MKRISGISSLTVLVIMLVAINAQAYQINVDSLKKHVGILASDSLEGRQVGEAGEEKAAAYIVNQFQTIGLTSKGIDGFRQSFEFVKEITTGGKNSLSINGTTLTINEEYIPMRQSANGTFNLTDPVFVSYGIKTKPEDGSYDDYSGKEVKGKGVIILRHAPAKDSNPHVNFDKYASITDKINTAIEAGASAILLITPSDKDDTLPRFGATNISPKEIPIVYIRQAGLKKIGLDLDKPAITNAVGEVELVKTRDTGYNVIGMLPGKSDTCIVIGAHYDHLGWGSEASLYAGSDRQIHNGADDNASGTAGVIELARLFASQKEKLHYSLLFMAFSGEESGLLGSNHFVKHMTVDSSKIRMMLNMDMIGRLSGNDTGLAVFGTGTSTEFKSYFETYKRDDIKLAFREPGTGPSDHTAFYNRNIPVLHFFTGAHSDYHKPSDDADKIDYDGMVKVLSVISDITDAFESKLGPLTFQKTVDPNAGKMSSGFSVTLGIMPDYVAEVKGLQVDGVSANRPAERAGIKAGDIIIRLGAVSIADINDYMTALGKFRKNDSTMAVVVRGADTLSLPVVFK